MALLVPDSRPRMAPEQPQDRGRMFVFRLGGENLDTAEVLGIHIAVLVGADQPGRRSMVTVERAAVEAVGDEYLVSEGVLDRDGRPVAVEAEEHDMADRRRGRKRRFDVRAIQRLERNPSQ